MVRGCDAGMGARVRTFLGDYIADFLLEILGKISSHPLQPPFQRAWDSSYVAVPLSVSEFFF